MKKKRFKYQTTKYNSPRFLTSLKLRKSNLNLNLLSNFKVKNNQKCSTKFGLCFRIKHY
jgi:hypothetical protein